MHFEVYRKQKNERADYFSGTTKPREYPCVELVHNYDWSDYGYNNWFCIWYFQDEKTWTCIGDVKIMTTQAMTTIDALGDEFEGRLDDSFCSLGMDINYYLRARELFAREGKLDCFMRSLCDCVYNPEIYERFHDFEEFNISLTRDQSSQEALVAGKAFLLGLSKERAYAFNFTSELKVGQNTQQVVLKVNFPFGGPIYKRTIGVIGENGTGKTQMLSNLARSIISNDTIGFDSVPIFNSCVVLSSTPFDRYPRIEERQRIQYAYYSLEQDDSKTDVNLAKAINRIIARPVLMGERLVANYEQTIKDSIGDIMSNILIWKQESQSPGEERCLLNKEELSRVVKIMSSGQLHLFTLITYLFDNIHLSTLLLIDEPEVHLHPHTVVIFMRVLADVLSRFRSYAIIATHSPLIVREMVQTNVQVLRKVEEDVLLLNPVACNTFGEDITTLYYNIFDYDIKDSFFTHLINHYVEKKKSYEEIVQELGPEIQLGLSARMTIRDLIEEKKTRDA